MLPSDFFHGINLSARTLARNVRCLADKQPGIVHLKSAHNTVSLFYVNDCQFDERALEQERYCPFHPRRFRCSSFRERATHRST